jgi:sugar lactone lactonase YvrE
MRKNPFHWRSRAVLRAASLGVALATVSFLGAGYSVAGAVTSSSWTSNSTPFSIPDGNANQFAADAMGNVYYVSGGALMRWAVGAGSSSLVAAGPFRYSSFTVDGQGNSYFSIGSSVIEVSPLGVQSTVTTSLSSPGALAVDPAGHVYVVDDSVTPYPIDEVVNGSLVRVGTLPTRPHSIAVGSDGTVYASDYTGGNVYQVSNGVTTSLGTGWNTPETVTVDGAGIVYVADEGLGVTMVTSGGTMTGVTPTSSDPFCSEQVFVGGSTLYYADECSRTIYTTPVTPLSVVAGRPAGLSVTGALSGAGNAPTQTVTAHWLAGTGATSYVCTLLYGYGAPSSFKVSTSATSCSFYGLSPTTAFGVSVVSLSGSIASTPSVGFEGTPAWVTSSGSKHSVLCQKNGSPMTKWVTNANPRCPSGWHRTLLL